MQHALRPFRFVLLGVVLFWAISAAFLATPTAAQIVRIRPGMGIDVITPYSNIYIAPRFGVRPRYDVPRADGLSRRRAWRRRRDLGQPRDQVSTKRSGLALEPKSEPDQSQGREWNSGSSTDASPSSFDESPMPTATTASAMQNPARPYPTATDLANLDDARLSAALADIANRLDASLARYKTGVGWQRYLRFPEDIMAPSGFSSHEDLESLQIKQDTLRKTLTRFEQVANTTDFRIIARQPSFSAALAALREVATRLEQRNMDAPITPITPATVSDKQEVLPTPEPARRQVAPTGERSILKR